MKKRAPKGYSVVSPHLMVDNTDAQVAFLTNVFGAEVIEVFRDPGGSARHATVRIGDTSVMLGRSMAEFPATPAMNYVFVDDADAVFRTSLDHGATPIMEPQDQFFGHRQCGIRDPQGNVWWIAKFLRHVPPDELHSLANQTS